MTGADDLLHPRNEKTGANEPNQLWQTDFMYLKVVGWGWLEDRGMGHTRSAPYRPVTQGKIERTLVERRRLYYQEKAA